MRNYLSFTILLSVLFLSPAATAQVSVQQNSSSATWSFAASGDSRNCGDVVMPAIAAGIQHDGAAFYWHLGDLRAIYTFDEDILHQPQFVHQPPSIYEYEAMTWDDFIRSQIDAFGSTPFFLGIGNHETIPPKTHDQFLIQFADWLDSPELRAQRLRDNPDDHALHAYYHWIRQGIDFIYLDNSTPDQFSLAQIAWFERILQADASNAGIHTLVVGMHEALPESISSNHSMNEFFVGIETGRRVYADLLKSQNEAHKRVYVLASHSHYFMGNVFNTAYWRSHGGVLPGWIVGTAGAVRYPLPPNASEGQGAQTNVYGYLLATVQPDDTIDFQFHKLNESDIPAAVSQKYGAEFVHWCFAHNSQTAQP